MYKILFKGMNRSSIITYILIICLLSLHADPANPLLDIIGGFQTTGFLEIFEIVCWVLCVLPPVAASVLFLSIELGGFSVYTVLRSHSILNWWLPRLFSVIITNIIYFFTVLLFCAIRFSFIITDWTEIIFLGVRFISHSSMVSLLSILLLVTTSSLASAVIAFIFVDGISVAVGSVLPRLCKFLPPFWGMAQNRRYLMDNPCSHFWISQIVTFAVCLVSAAIILIHLSKYNPAAYPYNV